MRTTKRFSHLLTVSLIAAASLSSAQGLVTGVSVASSSNGLAVVVRGQKLAAPSISRAENGTVYVASFRGELKVVAGKNSVNRHGVTTVQWSQASKHPPVSRIVLRLQPSNAPVVAPIEGGYKITLGSPEPELMNPPVAVPIAGPIGQTVSAQATPSTPVLPLPQPSPKPVTAAATPKPMNPLVSQIVPASASSVGKTVTLEFDDAKVSQILKAIAIQAGVNIVTAPEVEDKKLTIKLEKVTTDHAMNVITAMSGLRYQQVGNTIVVAPADRLDEIVRNIKGPSASIGTQAATTPEKVESRIVPVYSHRRTQVETAVYRTLPRTSNSGGYELVWPEEADDYVMIIGAPSRLGEAERSVRSIDQQICTALGVSSGGGADADEFVVYDVQYSEPRALRDELVQHVHGLRVSISPGAVGNPRLYDPKGTTAVYGGSASTPLAAQAQAGGAAGGTEEKQGAAGGTKGFQGGLQQPYNEFENVAQPMRLILRGSKEQMSVAHRVLKALDVAPRLVALEIRVMELSKEDALNIGLDWNIFTGGAVKFLNVSTAIEQPSGSGGVSLNNRHFTGDVVATLDKIANTNNLIARPNMLAPDGRESELFIGDAIRYVETITSSQNGPSVQIGTVRVGINLAVLPRISADGTVTLDLRPVVSFLTGWKRVSVQGFAAELPQTSERIAQQTIPMKSGETFAISGLIQSQDVNQLKGIPILMDLPLIGALFRRTTTQTIRKELVVFVTAKSITGPLSTHNSGMPMEPDSVIAAKAKKGK